MANIPASMSAVPTEAVEQSIFVQWLELQGLTFTAIPNSTYTTSWSQKRKNQEAGLRAGFPDLVVCILPDQSTDNLGHFIAIEMKRLKGGRTSEQQKDWVDKLNLSGVDATVCKGAEAAITFVSQYIKDVKKMEIF